MSGRSQGRWAGKRARPMPVPMDPDDWADSDEGAPPPTYDRMGVHVMREQCSTCIFRPGNLMDLQPGRSRTLCEETDAGDTNVICHQTLDRETGAICRGSWERRPGAQAQIAERLGMLRHDGEGDK